MPLTIGAVFTNVFIIFKFAADESFEIRVIKNASANLEKLGLHADKAKPIASFPTYAIV